MHLILPGLLAALVTGSIVYCAMVVVAVRRYLRERRGNGGVPHRLPPISILKPLHGLDDGLDENLRSFFRQDYPEFEVLLGIDHRNDPALPIAERIRAEFPGIPSRIVVAGDSPYCNPKDHSLETMAKAASHEVLVMSDSDIRVTPEMLRTVAGEFADAKTGCITCPYRAVPGPSFWTRLEAIGMNTEFMSGVLVARMLEGMKFGVGPTMVVRKEALEKIGWMSRVGDSYIDDFLIGKYIAEAGYCTDLSAYVIEHRIESLPFWKNIKHRVMWQRGTRFSRPAGYYGQLFTYPIPLALLLLAAAPALWPLAAAAFGMRYAAAAATAGKALHDPLFQSRWFLLPLQDTVAFLSWTAAFFGNSIQWRGRRYRLGEEGKLMRC
jgi:ceramide glucosyltransferase